MPWNRFLLILLSVTGVLIAGGLAFVLSTTSAAPAVPAAPRTTLAERPPESLTVTATDIATIPSSGRSTRSAFASEAQKLRDELSEHDVPFTEADAVAIIAIGEQSVARNIPDLSANDPVITEQVNRMFPHYTRQQRKDVIRCVAEYVEQVIARQSGDGIPPDERDRPRR